MTREEKIMLMLEKIRQADSMVVKAEQMRFDAMAQLDKYDLEHESFHEVGDYSFYYDEIGEVFVDHHMVTVMEGDALKRQYYVDRVGREFLVKEYGESRAKDMIVGLNPEILGDGLIDTRMVGLVQEDSGVIPMVVETKCRGLSNGNKDWELNKAKDEFLEASADLKAELRRVYDSDDEPEVSTEGKI